MFNRKLIEAQNKKISKLNSDNYSLITEISELRKKLGDPKYVVEKVMGRGINFFDNNSLSHDKKRQYYAAAQSALKNNALMNELNHLLAETVEYIAKHASNFDEVRDMRMQINFATLLRERLESIQDPENTVMREDINSVI